MRHSNQAERAPELPHKRLQTSLGYLSSRVTDPVRKLWFIKKTLERYGTHSELVRRLPVVRSIVFHYVALESFGSLAWRSEPGVVSFPRAPLFLLFHMRHVLLVVTVAALALSTYWLLGAARTGADWAAARLIPLPNISAPVSVDFHPNRSSNPPTSVWLVTQNTEEELWSNGLRVDTQFAIDTHRRRYLHFPKDGSAPTERSGPPVGIVYHASQSDMAPFSREFSTDILETTHALLGWLQRREIYHYMIDRFGRVYRIVDDDDVAVHAGTSIWEDEESYYLNLNDSFIGVAFESRWDTGKDLITPAQVQAAMNLTDVLRLRYSISDINCVPHGLVSVNATKRLIGYHADWAQGFPFNALGLSDKYALPPASMTAFGFGYDEDLVGRLGGELWPGVERAETLLRERAESEGSDVQRLRSRLGERYDEMNGQWRTFAHRRSNQKLRALPEVKVNPVTSPVEERVNQTLPSSQR